MLNILPFFNSTSSFVKEHIYLIDTRGHLDLLIIIIIIIIN